MNHAYRLVWNERLSAYVPAPEFARGRGKKSFRLRALSAAVLASLAVTAHAFPGGGQISAGQGSIAQSGSAMTVTQQSPRLAIDWLSFSIGANEAVRFNQPSASSIALNRVLGQDPSQIFGSLSANGQVFLLNPNGVLFGPGAQVNVAGIVASTLSLSNTDFLAGRYTFAKGASAGAVVNQGTLSAADGGYVALLGPQVKNEGVITAKLGTAALAAGNQVTVNLNGSSLVSLSVDQGALDALAQNKQLIQADGGTVIMTAKAADRLLAAVVNNEGVIEARTLVNQGGKIKLLADMDAGVVKVSGTLDASAPNGGDGGFIETSGAQVKVGDGARITTAAAQGKTGLWLIDPADYTIAASGGDISGFTLGSNLNNTDVTILSSQGSNINGSGDINVNDFVGWNANTTLKLAAERDVNVNAGLNFSNNAAGLDLISGRDVNVRNSNIYGSGNINVQSSGGLNVAAITWGAGLNANGRIDISAGGGVAVDAGTAPGAFAQIRSGSGQIISAKSISVTARGGNTAEIQNGPTGDQVINIDGAGTGAGIDVVNAGSASGWATLSNFASGGAQNITLTNADHIRVAGTAGPAQLTANGNQAIFVSGSQSNAIQVGDPNAVSTSQIGVTNNNIGVTQTISTLGPISLVGGVAAAGGASAVISSNGGGGQSVSANGIVLRGGASGDNNNATISSNNDLGVQTITAGSGGIRLAGGGGNSNNSASIDQRGASADQRIVDREGDISLTGGTSGMNSWAQISSWGGQTIDASGRSISVIGGSDGTNNGAQIWKDSDRSQVIFAKGISLQGGSGGSNNIANINTNNWQNVPRNSAGDVQILNIGSGGIQVAGGAGGVNNTAAIGQNDRYGAQSIGVAGGDISVRGGAAGNWAQIWNNGAAQDIFLGDADHLNVIGAGGSANINSQGDQTITLTGSGRNAIQVGEISSLQYSGINANNAQHVTSGNAGQAGSITIAAGSADGAGSSISNNSGTQDVNTSGVITITGGSAPNGTGSSISSGGTGQQTITANALALIGGASGANNGAQVNAWNNASSGQSITVGSGGISLRGGDGAGGNNSAWIVSGGTTGAQAVEVNGGSVSLRGGNGNTTNNATINSSGTQTLSLKGDSGPNALQIGNAGAAGAASVTAFLDQTITAGLQGQQGSISIAGGSGSFAIGYLRSDANQTINSSGSLTVQGGSGPNAWSQIWSAGGSQSINLGGGLTLTAGTSHDSTINAANGQTINANFVEVTGQGGSQANISNRNSGNQVITTSGTNGAGEGIAVRSLGTARGTGINNLAPGGSQSITVNNADYVRVVGEGGNANIGSNRNQTLVIQGAASFNALEIGSPAAHGSSNLGANGAQTVSANSIAIRAATAGMNGNASISTNGSTQTINVHGGNLSLYGGGSGPGDSFNSANLSQYGQNGSQIVNIYGGGSVYLQGGSGSGAANPSPWCPSGCSGNSASINNGGTGGQAINFIGAPGSIALYGGSNGTSNSANIGNSGGSQVIGSGGYGASILVQAGPSGGAYIDQSKQLGNTAYIWSNASQTVYARDVSVWGGSGGIDNFAKIGVGGTNSGNSQTLIASGNVDVKAGAGGVANVFVFGGGTQTITAAGTLTLTGAPGSTAFYGGVANISAGDPINPVTQTITAGSISLNGSQTGMNGQASISAGLGAQNIAAGGIALTGGQGEGNSVQISAAGSQILTVGTGGIQILGGAGGSNNTASINQNNSSGAQAITVNDGSVSVIGGSGSPTNNASVNSSGSQTLSIQGGSSSNSLQIGSATALGSSTVNANGGAQSITAGIGAQAGAISILGGAGAGTTASIDSYSASQTVSTTGTINVAGGTANNASGTSSLARIRNLGAGTQSVTAKGINLAGGAGGSNNLVRIVSNGNSGTQVIAVGSDGLNIAGGSGAGGGNAAAIYQFVASGTQTVTVSGGNVHLTGGVSGDGNSAQINSSGAQNVGAAGMTLVGGSGGTNNYAQISSSYDQQIGTSTAAGITIQGGAGTGYGNYAQISHGGAGGNQTINVNGGAVVLQGGSGTGTATNNPSLVPAVCAGDAACLTQPVTSDWAQIYSAVGNQSLKFLSAGTLSIAGGSGGNRNQASVSNGGTGTQTVSGAGPLDIALTGGSSGGNDYTSTDGVHYLRNNASIFSPSGAQSISGSSLTMKGASNLADAGSGNTAFSIYGKGQAINIAGPISLEAGAGASASVAIVSLADQVIAGTTLGLTAGSNGNGNRAAIETYGNQQISLSGALTLSGGGGTGPAAGYNNYAQIRQLSPGAFSQSVTAPNGISIAGGSGAGMNGGTGDCGASCTGLSSSNNAGIYNGGSLGQTVSAGSAGILLQGGSAGNRNNAFIQNKSAGPQQIASGSLWLQGGDSGGMDSRTLSPPAQSVFGSSYLTNNATITSGFYDLAGTQLINTGTGAITLKGNGGSGSGMTGATIASVGAQTIFGGTIDLTGGGGSATGTSASILSLDRQAIGQPGARPNITLTGGDSGGTFNGNEFANGFSAKGGNAAVIASGNTLMSIPGTQTIHANRITLKGTPLSGSATSVGGAGIFSAGDQTLDVTGAIDLWGGDSANLSRTRLWSLGGTQTINADSLSVTGATSGASGFNIATVGSWGQQFITLSHANGPALTLTTNDAVATNVLNNGAYGNQTLTFTGANARLSIRGANAALGTNNGDAPGNQSIQFTNGGSIVLTGVGATDPSNANGASINAYGTQSITGATSIAVHGGSATHGNAYVSAAGDQTISAQQVSLYGGASAASIFSETGNANIVVSTGFSNDAGAGALSPTSIGAPAATGRWLIWAPDPSAIVGGGLVHDFAQYNASFTPTPTTPLASGNGLMYAFAPTLVPSFAAAVTKVYDGTTAVPGTTSLAATGAVYGDTVSLSSGSILYDTRNAGTNKTVTASALSVSASDVAGKPVYGYQLPSSVSTGTGEITPASLSASIIGTPTKTYDGNSTAMLNAGNYLLQGFVGTESASVTKAAGSYNSKDVVTATTVSTSLANGDFTASGGTLLGNYLLPTGASGAGAITPATLTLAGVRAYDGTVVFLPGAFGAAGTIAGVAGETLKLTGQGSVASPNASTTPQPLSKGTLALANGSGLASNYAIAASGNTGRITTNVPASTASCKDGGWQFLSMVDGGATFRNQGQCIQFVNTGK